MIISLKKVIELLLMGIIFILLTFIFYQLIRWGLDWITPHFQFERPSGSSIEVMFPSYPKKEEDQVRLLLYHFWGNGE